MADLVRDDVVAGEVAAGAELRLELVEEAEVDVDLLVRRAVERSHRGLRETAARFHGPVEEHERRLLVLAAELLEDAIPGVFRFRERDGGLLPPFRFVRRLGVGLVRRLNGTVARALQHRRGIPAEEHHEQGDRQRAEAAAHESATADAHAAPILDVVALSASLPAHGGYLGVRTARAAGSGRAAVPRTGAPGS